MNMKKLVALVVAGMMSVLLTGCGQQAPKQPDVKAEQEVAAPAAHEAAAPAAEPAAAPAPAAEPAPQQ